MASDCTNIGTLDETYNLNLPSITVGTVTGSVIVARNVTNVGTSSATYTAAVTTPPGFNTTVSPSSLTLAPGETKSFTVTIAGAGAAEGVWQFGQLVWSDGTHTVRSPIQAKAGKAISAPTEFTDTIMFCQGERHMLELAFRHPGRFMFHAHQSEFAELGWMGFFDVREG